MGIPKKIDCYQAWDDKPSKIIIFVYDDTVQIRSISC